ncbi:hypothetical protein [Paraliomyxa miuraensis]|uniref:hypothetical protein n=1 Tax=Paraliomyxa miuraensis TaxID=376150 RepID=UPI00224E8EC7|nr:hypothetical protein [Paraliomyxa miuraensis]MCX4244998.1 hypothetical protein [Paraliomyxa miuraensis]
MSNLRTGIIVLVAVSFGGLNLADRMWGTPRGRTMERRLNALERERDALAEQTRDLRDEQVRMRDDQRALAWHETRSATAAPDRGVAIRPRASSSPGSAPERSIDDPRVATAEPAPPPPTTEQLQQGLEQVFDEGDDDPAWSRGAEQQLRDGLHQALDGRTAVASVECNGTVCRIESDHDDMASFRGYAEDTLLGSDRELWKGAIFTSVVEGDEHGGPVTAVTFVAREGEALPGIAG